MRTYEFRRITSLKSFFVQSAYGFLRGEEEGRNLRLYDFFWKIKALPSAQVTAWRVIENKLATRVNLERHGVEINSNLCCLCGGLEESTNHLFFGCKIYWLVWNLCYAWLGVSSRLTLLCLSHILYSSFLLMRPCLPILLWIIFGLQWLARTGDI